MATHFARGILTEGHLISVRLPSHCHQEARNIPPHRQSRFLASRGLLAELMFMLYGIGELPEIVTLPNGGERDCRRTRFVAKNCACTSCQPDGKTGCQ